MKKVRELFPNREKLRRSRRGYPPIRSIIPPLLDELVAIAHKEIIFKFEENDKGIVYYFYLLRKQNMFGYLRLREMRGSPFSSVCKSYDQLQFMYDDIRRGAIWVADLEMYVNKFKHVKKISGHNINFMEKVSEIFKDLFPKKQEEPQVTEAIEPQGTLNLIL